MSMTTDAIVTTARSTHSATMNDTQRKLRYEVMKFLLRECRPPTVQDLVSQGFEDEVSVTTGLEKLRDLHHLALYEPGTPSPTPIAMAHPFSHLPTPNVVTSQGKSWWCNCAWCAFGLASMLSPQDSTVHILTSSGDSIHIPVTNDQIGDEIALQNYYAVFSSPPSKWWRDVRFACSGIQVCTSRTEAEQWHDRHGFYTGDIITLNQLWKLSKAWYHDKASYEYERKSQDEKDKLFKDIGLTSSYWSR